MEDFIRCMLVDDDIDDREIFMLALTDVDKSIRCRTAANGIEALRILGSDSAEKPDFIFLDVNMPKMNGLECLTEIRSSEQFADCEIYMYSTTAQEDLMESSKKLNAGFIVKPVDISTLREILRSILLK